LWTQAHHVWIRGKRGGGKKKRKRKKNLAGKNPQGGKGGEEKRKANPFVRNYVSLQNKGERLGGKNTVLSKKKGERGGTTKKKIFSTLPGVNTAAKLGGLCQREKEWGNQRHRKKTGKKKKKGKVGGGGACLRVPPTVKIKTKGGGGKLSKRPEGGKGKGRVPFYPWVNSPS